MRQDITQHYYYYYHYYYYCQKMGKLNQCIPPAPLVTVPHITETFSITQVDVVGPFLKTSKGFGYLFTMNDTSTKYLHAITHRKISAKSIIKALLDLFLTFWTPLLYSNRWRFFLRRKGVQGHYKGAGYRTSCIFTLSSTDARYCWAFTPDHERDPS